MKKLTSEDGFTVIEIVIFFVILTVLAVFFVLQKMDLESSFADQERKTAINAIYYNLTEIYHPKNDSYPSKIDYDTLIGIDPDLLFDPWDRMIGEVDSDYKYEGLNCDTNNRCKEFRLTAKLEKEEDYTIESGD
jgi:competence protein ComGC